MSHFSCKIGAGFFKDENVSDHLSYRKQILRKSILQSPALCGEIDRRKQGRERHFRAERIRRFADSLKAPEGMRRSTILWHYTTIWERWSGGGGSIRRLWIKESIRIFPYWTIFCLTRRSYRKWVWGLWTSLLIRSSEQRRKAGPMRLPAISCLFWQRNRSLGQSGRPCTTTRSMTAFRIPLLPLNLWTVSMSRRGIRGSASWNTWGPTALQAMWPAWFLRGQRRRRISCTMSFLIFIRYPLTATSGSAKRAATRNF